MGYKVIIGRTAEKDLLRIYRYIARENPDAAGTFVAKLIAEAKSLQTLPDRGGLLKERPGARFTVVGRYLLIYRILEKEREVLILRFWHSARERRRRPR